jgi:hypothetical protein
MITIPVWVVILIAVIAYWVGVGTMFLVDQVKGSSSVG